MKPGIVIISELTGAIGERFREIQARFDPRMAGELPVHLTVAGSSGMGPIAPTTPIETLQAALEPVGRETAPFEVRLLPPHRFMQSKVVVMLIDPNGPIRALHERIKSSGLPFEQPRFTFTPHVTLSFYPEHSRERLRELMQLRIEEPVRVEAFQVYRTETLTRTQRLFEVPLTGA